MNNNTIITCNHCGKKVSVDKILLPDFDCPKCGRRLPIEGDRGGEYVIVCPCWGYYFTVNTPQEICENEGKCSECGGKLDLYLAKHFPVEIKGRMCPLYKEDETFDPEYFDDSECQDCRNNDCPFVDPNWWKEEMEYWQREMFPNCEDDEELDEDISGFIDRDYDDE